MANLHVLLKKCWSSLQIIFCTRESVVDFPLKLKSNLKLLKMYSRNRIAQSKIINNLKCVVQTKHFPLHWIQNKKKSADNERTALRKIICKSAKVILSTHSSKRFLGEWALPINGCDSRFYLVVGYLTISNHNISTWISFFIFICMLRISSEWRNDLRSYFYMHSVNIYSLQLLPSTRSHIHTHTFRFKRLIPTRIVISFI